MSQFFLKKTRDYGKMIKFSHTIFALPFALSAVVLAWQSHPASWADLAWILVAMVGARSAAMGFNRIADAAIDGKNPRTAIREIPAGVLSVKEAVLFVGVSSLVFILAAAMLSPVCLFLSVPVLGALFFLLLHQKVHPLLPPLSWICHFPGTGGSLDRHHRDP